MDNLTLVSLNVLYSRIDAASPHHFTRRWVAIQTKIRGRDVINLQEVHEDFLPHVKEFAFAEGCTMVT